MYLKMIFYHSHYECYLIIAHRLIDEKLTALHEKCVWIVQPMSRITPYMSDWIKYMSSNSTYPNGTIKSSIVQALYQYSQVFASLFFFFTKDKWSTKKEWRKDAHYYSDKIDFSVLLA